MAQYPGAGDPLSYIGPSRLADEGGRRAAPITPAVIPIPEVGRDPGVRYGGSPVSVHLPQIQDPRGQAMSQFSNDMGHIAAEFKKLYEDRKGIEDKLFAEEFNSKLSVERARITAEALSSPDTGRPDFVNIVDTRIAESARNIRKELETTTGYQPGRIGSYMVQHYEMQARTESGVITAKQGVAQREALAKIRVGDLVKEVENKAAMTDDLDGALIEAERVVSPLQPLSTPAEYDAARKKARSDIGTAVVNARSERGDTYGVTSLLDRARGYPANPLEYRAADLALQLGVTDPRELLELMRADPKYLDITGRQTAGTMSGATKFIATSGRKYGISDDPNQRGAAQNAELATYYYVELRNSLRMKLGRDPTPGEMRLGWSGLEELVGAGTSTKAAAGLVTDDAAIAANTPLLTVLNPDGSERMQTVAEVHALAEKSMLGMKRDPATNLFTEAQRHILVGNMDRMREQQLKAQEAGRARTSDEVMKNVQDLYREQKLTPEILQQYRPLMKSSDYTAAFKLFDQQSADMAVSEVADLYRDKGTTPPEEYQARVIRAINNNWIDAKVGFPMIHENAVASRKDQPEGPYKAGEDLLKMLTNPQGLTGSTATLMSQMQGFTLAAYANWRRENPQASVDESVEAALRIHRQNFRAPLEIRTPAFMPWVPYFPEAKAPEEIRLPDVEVAQKTVNELRRTRGITVVNWHMEDYKLKQWRTMLELQKRDDEAKARAEELRAKQGRGAPVRK